MDSVFRNVLYVVLEPRAPTDALAEAATVADWFDATLSVQAVLPPVPRRQVRLGLEPEAVRSSTEQILGEWAASQLADAATRRTGVASLVVDSGRLVVEVIARVRREHNDLVIVAPGSSPDRLATVRRLIRVCPCPVLVVRGPIGCGDLLAAVDPDDRLELNVMLLSVARSWSRAAGVAVDVVHGFETYQFGHELSPVGATSAATFAARVEEAHRDGVRELLERVGGDWVRHVHVVSGAPSDAIARTVDDMDCSLVVVGSAGRRSMARALIGNTADRVLSRTSASLLVIKPPGFNPALDGEPGADSEPTFAFSVSS